MDAHAGDLSVLDFFLQADLVVKSVMILLLAMSVLCWSIIIEKWLTLQSLTRRAKLFEETFWSSNSLEVLYDKINRRPGDPMAAAFVAGMGEWRRGMSHLGSAAGKSDTRIGLTSRIDGVMGLAINREMGKVENRLTVLASVGSTAPFIGLFGTVWGIMNSFTAIAAEGNASLVTVAPGIAEALFVTAMGLVAAIPATLAYNKFAGDLSRYSDRLNNFATELGTILARHMEEAMAAK